MQYVHGKDAKSCALIVSKNEWGRLQQLITKKNDDKAIIEEIKRLKDERRAMSKAMAETWATTTLV